MAKTTRARYRGSSAATELSLWQALGQSAISNGLSLNFPTKRGIKFKQVGVGPILSYDSACRHRSVPPFAGASPGALECEQFARCLRDNHEPAHSPYADPSDLGATQKAGRVAPRFYMTVAALTKRWPGREEQVQRLVGAVSAAGAPPLFVYGASSTGKTSVVRQALPADFDMGLMLAGVSHPKHKVAVWQGRATRASTHRCICQLC